MNIYPSDQALVKRLVEKRKRVQSVPPEKRNSELDGWGILFLDLFRDINDSLSFSVVNGTVNVHIGDDTVPHGKDFNEDTYLHYNQTMDLQVKVLQRLLLLRQLEENRLIVWINSGKRMANYNFEDVFFYLINEDDCNLVREKFNYEAVATKDLIDYFENGFKSTDDLRFEKTFCISKISLGVAIIVGIFSIVFNVIALCR